MAEIIIQKNGDEKIIALVDKDKLIEYYEENDFDNRNEGNIYVGVVRDIIKGMQSAFVDIGTKKNSLIHLKDILFKVDETQEVQKIDVDIEDVVEPNQKILVQVKKDSSESKGARVSTHINLPGKYIALLPNTNIITVSHKIEDEEEQNRLKKLVRENISSENGAIIRTSAKGKTKEVIEDIKYMEEKWERIIGTVIEPNSIKPQLLYASESILEKMLIDLPNEIEKIIVNNKEIKDKIEIFKKENPEYSNVEVVLKLKPDVLENDSIKKQINKIDNRKIWLKCGGFITIDKTEALTAIDVNTGKYTGNNDLEQTVLKVNQEATKEIAKQLRLRDIGGIVIIDYIDMQEQESRQKIEELLKMELKKDRSKTQVEGFTKLDLMELTRKHICSHNKD